MDIEGGHKIDNVLIPADIRLTLQIWIMPRERNTRPVYQDFSITELERPNELAVIVSPDGSTPASLLKSNLYSSTLSICQITLLHL